MQLYAVGTCFSCRLTAGLLLAHVMGLLLLLFRPSVMVDCWLPVRSMALVFTWA